MLSYLIASLGISGSMHYCGGNLASISFGSDGTNKCACGSENMEKDCCQDKDFYLRLDDGQQKPPQVSFDFSKSFDFDLAVLSVSQFLLYDPSWAVTHNYISPHPPNNVKPPLYVLNCVFRI